MYELQAFRRYITGLLTLLCVVLLGATQLPVRAQAEDPIPKMIQQMHNTKDYIKSWQAVHFLVAASNDTDPRAADAIIAALKSKDAALRNLAMGALFNVTAPRIMDALVEILNDPTNESRTTAGYYLARATDPRAVEPLTTLLKTGKPAEQNMATMSLASYGSQGATILLEALKTANADMRPKLLSALGQTGDAQALEAILLAAKDPDVTIRAQAMTSLANFKTDVRAQKMLLDAMKDPEQKVRDSAVFAQASSTDPHALVGAIDAMATTDPKLRLQYLNTIGNMSDPRVEACIAALKDKDVNLRNTAAAILGQLHDERAIPALIEALKDDNKLVRQQAAQALGQMKYNTNACVEPLIAALKDTDLQVRTTAATALGQLDDKRAVLPLVDLLKDKDENVRALAARSLGMLKDARAVDGLLAAAVAAGGTKNNWNRISVISALGQIGDQRAIPTLIPMLKDTDGYVRGSVASVLGDLKDPAAVDPLLLTLKEKGKATTVPGGTIATDSYLYSRQIAASALGKLKDPKAIDPLLTAGASEEALAPTVALALKEFGSPVVEPLLAVLKGTDLPRKRIAVQTLGTLADLRAVEPLQALLTDPDVKLRITAGEALGKLKAAGVAVTTAPIVAALLPLAQAGEKATRKAAITALGVVKDPTAVDPLLALLKDPSQTIAITAVSALSSIGTPAAIDGIIALLKDGNNLSLTAIYQLNTLKERRAVPALIEALGNAKL
ncbi:MAG: HEAT repeat domain-containing protein, partial [bacterium]